MEHLTQSELRALLCAAKEHRERDHVIILLAFWHGLRASEVTQLTPANFADGYISVQRLKGSNKTTQRLMEDPDELLNEKAAVADWLRKHQEKHLGDGNGQRLFAISRIQFYHLMRYYGRQAGIPEHKCHPHVLKHSIAMQSIRQAGIENVRQWLGHKSIASTGAYLRVDDEAAGKAIASATRSQT